MHFNKEHHPFIYLIDMGDGEHDAIAAPIFGRRFVHCREKNLFPGNSRGSREYSLKVLKLLLWTDLELIKFFSLTLKVFLVHSTLFGF